MCLCVKVCMAHDIPFVYQRMRSKIRCARFLDFFFISNARIFNIFPLVSVVCGWWGTHFRMPTGTFQFCLCMCVCVQFRNGNMAGRSDVRRKMARKCFQQREGIRLILYVASNRPLPAQTISVGLIEGSDHKTQTVCEPQKHTFSIDVRTGISLIAITILICLLYYAAYE